MLSLQSLTFAINRRVFFKNISISFLPSAIVHIRGKNGSGKTAFIRMLAGIQAPTSGKITFSKKASPISLLKKPYCTYIGHNLAIKAELTVIENITFWAKLHDSEMLVEAALRYFQLKDIAKQKCSELSAGNQKKVALARLIACQSKLWLLDEVDTNLDKENQELMIKLILSHANNGGMVFFVSHNETPIKTVQNIYLSDFNQMT